MAVKLFHCSSEFHQRQSHGRFSSRLRKNAASSRTFGLLHFVFPKWPHTKWQFRLHGPSVQSVIRFDGSSSIFGSTWNGKT